MPDIISRHRMLLLYILVFLNILLFVAVLVSRLLSPTPPQSYGARLIWNFFTSEAFKDNSLSVLISLVISELLAIVILFAAKRGELALDIITAWLGWLKLALCVILSPIFLFAFWLPALVKRIRSCRERASSRRG